MHISELIRQKFKLSSPVFLSGDPDSLKFELKPYLQPFEQELAMRELRALLGTRAEIIEEFGYHVVHTNKPEDFFRERLTYWQRVGRVSLEPTVQKALELTQNGISETHVPKKLHKARRLRYGPHDLHEYRGKFFPQLVRSLMNISGVTDDALVFDPMCGSGTTTCEVVASGRSTIGADLNPLSVLISTVKTAVILEEPSEFQNTILSYLNSFIFDTIHPETIWTEKDLLYLSRWFDTAAIRDLAAIIAGIKTVSERFYQDFFKVCLSNIIRSVSWQKESDLRVRKEIKSYIPETAIERFKKTIIEQVERIYPYLCVLPRAAYQPKFSIRHGNAVNVAALFPEFQNKVDLLITSPPYATALPYLDTDRLSLIVLGLLPREKHSESEKLMIGTREISERQRLKAWECYLARKNELPVKITKLLDRIAEANHGDNVGFRKRNLPALLGKYFLTMLDSMRSAHKMLRKNGHAYYVVGNNSTIVDGQRIEIPTDKFLFEIGERAGWCLDEMIQMELLISRDIFKENRGTAETILCFRA